MLEKPSYTKLITQSTIIALCMGIVIWIMLLLQTASTLQGTAIGNYAVRLGPFIMNHISKSPLAQGSSLSISFEVGLLWFLLGWSVIGAITGLILAHTEATRQTE